MEPFIIDVMPTEDSDFVLSSHEGEEFIMVMEGVWKSAMVRIPICWKKVIVFTMTPSFLIMYMLTKGRLLKYWL